MFCDMIGSGSFGAVYKGYRVSDNMEVAIKSIQKPQTRSDGSVDQNGVKAIERASRELHTLKEVQRLGGHRHILRYVDVLQSREHLYIMTEHLSGKPLSVYADTFHRNPRILLEAVGQILSGLTFLHAQRIAHRDIKEENLILASAPNADWTNLRVVIIDLGLNKPNIEADIHTACGSPQYVAPEVLDQHTPFDPCASDVWSLGVVVYRLANGCSPYDLDQWRSAQQVIAQIRGLRGLQTPPPLKFYHQGSGPLYRLLDNFCIACLQPEPSQRPPTDSLLSTLTKELYGHGDWNAAHPR